MTAEVQYPLGHTSGECGRLNSQADLLHDLQLDSLIRPASNCLEIGAGIGSNVPTLRAANPNLNYLGVDNSHEAIQKARLLQGNSMTDFQVMDATQLQIADQSIDLVIIKLVLWSVGPRWPDVLQEAKRVLKSGGILYIFEPFDRGVVFSPERPAMETVIKLWDHAAIASGLDPHIGPKVPTALSHHEFLDIRTRFFPVVALTHETQKYLSICENLRRFYLESENGTLGSPITERLRSQAQDELNWIQPGGLVMDSFFVSTAKKPSN